LEVRIRIYVMWLIRCRICKVAYLIGKKYQYGTMCRVCGSISDTLFEVVSVKELEENLKTEPE
jgi:rRNA maturation endonuclease Nob1